MKILTIGDIVGEKAVELLEEKLTQIKEMEQIDFVIANAENADKGNGLSKDLYKRIIESGVNVITLGNHSWGNEEIIDILEKNNNIIRPANISKYDAGKGYTILNCKNNDILVINLMGRIFMEGCYKENPFKLIEKILNDIDKKIKIILIDFHAQECGEKFVMAYFLDGKVSAVFGTHTHVQSADEQILQNGTGFITDIGMTGPIESVLGNDSEIKLKRVYYDITDKELPDQVSNHQCMINGCIFDINETTGKTINIKKINVR